MPEIVYETRGFPHGALPSSGSSVKASKLALMNTASRSGDASVFGGLKRPTAELVWREAMIDAALDEGIRHGIPYWQRSASYDRLDPSEKSAVSYFLGMIQAQFMTQSLLRLSDVVHVDAVLALRGTKTRKRRPDLVGYQHPPGGPWDIGRVLIEAKGRTNDYDEGAVQTAKGQVEGASPEVEGLVGTPRLSIASLAYFANKSEWTSYLFDPPADRDQKPEVDDAAFAGLINIASLLPVASAIDEIRDFAPARVRDDSVTEMTQATLPGMRWAIGMPTELLRSTLEVAADAVTDEQARQWSGRMAERRGVAAQMRESILRERDDQLFLVDRDGVLVADISAQDEGKPSAD